MSEVKTERLNIRIEKQLKERLKQAAKAEERTTANLVTTIIKQWLDTNHPDKITPN